MIVVLGAVLLVACAPAAAPTVVPTTIPVAPTATAVAKIKVRSSYSQINPDASVIWVAKEMGIFDKNGLEVDLIFINGGTQQVQALLAGDDQIAFTAASPIVSADAGGGDLALIAGIVNRVNYDFIAVPSIKTGADLKGKKVAVSGLSGSSYTAMRIALRDLFKLDPDKDVAILTIGNETEREAALLSGQIQGTVVNPDLSIKAKKDGLVVLDSLWGKDIPYQHTAIASRRAFIKDNPQAVTRYLMSLIQSVAYIKDPTNKANVQKVMAKYLKTDDQEYLDSGYDRIAKTVYQCAPYVTLDGLKSIIAETKAAVEKGMTPEQVTDNSFVKSLEDNGFVKANCK